MGDYYEEDEGLHFNPYDDEIINEYLIPKLKGDDHSGDFIVHKNVYAKEPWLLDHNMDPFFQKDEWYYFVTRTQVSEKKIGCGKKAKRKITGDNNDGIERGNWKANATTDIVDKKTKKVIGKKQTLTYTRSNNNKKQKTGDGACAIVPGSNSSWIMKEYMLPEGENFQELVLCKIKIKKSKKKDDNHEASTSTSTSHHHEASTSTSHHHHDFVLASSSSSQQQPTRIDPEINKSKNDEASSSVPLVANEHESSLPIGSGEEEEETEWTQEYGLSVEECQNFLNLVSCDATESSQLC